MILPIYGCLLFRVDNAGRRHRPRRKNGAHWYPAITNRMSSVGATVVFSPRGGSTTATPTSVVLPPQHRCLAHQRSRSRPYAWLRMKVSSRRRLAANQWTNRRVGFASIIPVLKSNSATSTPHHEYRNKKRRSGKANCRAFQGTTSHRMSSASNLRLKYPSFGWKAASLTTHQPVGRVGCRVCSNHGNR
jgi:hypothetical protein